MCQAHLILPSLDKFEMLSPLVPVPAAYIATNPLNGIPTQTGWYRPGLFRQIIRVL